MPTAARVHQRLARQDRGVVGQELRGQVVRTVDHRRRSPRAARAALAAVKRLVVHGHGHRRETRPAIVRRSERPLAAHPRRRGAGPGGAGCSSRPMSSSTTPSARTPAAAQAQRGAAAEAARADEQHRPAAHRLKDSSRAEVALAGVGQHRDHGLARPQLARDIERDLHRRARRRCPTSRPSRLASASFTAWASSLVDGPHLRDQRAVQDLGHEAGADAVDPVRRRPAARTAPRCLLGSTATIRTRGNARRSTRPTPVMVPPVPTPATKASQLRPTRLLELGDDLRGRWCAGGPRRWRGS